MEDLLSSITAILDEDKDLPGPEQRLVEEVYAGRDVSLSEDETIRAEVLRLMCLHTEEVAGGQIGRLCIKGGAVDGDLDLGALRLDFTLRFENTALRQLVLKDTRLLALEIAGGSATEISADRLEIVHDVVMTEGFTCTGPVWLRSARIAGDLNCNGSSFAAEGNQPSLQLDGAHIGGRLFIRREHGRQFQANHGVYARNARIAGGVLGYYGQFKRELDLTRAQVQGNLSLRRASIGADLDSDQTALTLEAMHITRDLDLRETTVGGSELSLVRTQVDGSLVWDLIRPEEADGDLRVDLQQTRVHYLEDDLSGWNRVRARMEGFSFDGISVPRHESWIEPHKTWRVIPRGPKWLEARKKWLRSQPDEDWSPHPYDQLRAALQDSGEDAAARAIAIERERMRRKRGGLNAIGKAANWLYGVLLGHGYRPARFFLVSAVVVLAFWIPYQIGLSGCDRGNTATTCGDFVVPDSTAPEYSALLFSLDAFIPVDLGQTSSWTPRDKTGFVYLIGAESALGWLLAGLLVGAVTGILRRD